MTIRAQLADGRILEFPDGTDQAVIQATVKKMITPSQPPIVDAQAAMLAQPTQREINPVGETIGGIEGALSLSTGMIAEPVAGLAGIAGALNPFADPGEGVRMIEAARDFLTYKPKTESGKAALADVGEKLKPAIDKLEKLKQFLGDDAFEATGSPALAAMAATLPDAMLEVIGAGAGRRAATKAAQATSVEQAQQSALQQVANAESATGIRQLTTDVFPPETRTGKFMQQQGELIEGGQRAAQQQERVSSIDNLMTKFDVDDGARFESKIVESVKSSIGQTKKAMGELFEDSSNQLDKLGSVGIDKTRDLARQVLEKELRKGSLADQTVVQQMQDFIDAPDSLTFNDVKSVRSAVGNDLQNARKGAPVTGSSDAGLLSRLYGSLSEDMKEFAKGADPELLKKWREADEVFSEFAIGADKTGAKNLIKKGDATPEIVDQLLFSNKNSDLEFLKNNLTQSGKTAAGQRILQRILQKSTIDGTTINPNNFQTQTTKLRNQIFKFFDADERKAIISLRDTLAQTRRAQDAAVTTPTGQSVVPLFALTNPQVLIPGVAQALIERPTFRNLLIKRKAAKTAKERFSIDQELQTKINESGLLGAATTGATEQTLAKEQNK